MVVDILYMFLCKCVCVCVWVYSYKKHHNYINFMIILHSQKIFLMHEHNSHCKTPKA